MSYTYHISTDFPYQKVNPTTLTQQIAASKITIAVDYIDTFDDVCEIFFKAGLSQEEEEELNQIIYIHKGESTEKKIPVNSAGSPVVATTYPYVPDAWRMEGIRFTASGQTTTVYDYYITKEILMQGGHWWTLSHGLNDSADFSVVDKDNVLGLHTLYGLPPGYPIELKKFVKNYHIPSGLTTGIIQAPTVSPVVSGLYVRIAYDNNSDENAEIGVNYIYYEKA